MTLEAGTWLGPYEILSPLGAGGMGEVYRARDSRLARDVALKVLPPQFARDPDAVSRFEREAKAVAALSHPNILAIHDFGVFDGVAYTVSELLQGETLRERLSAGGLPPRKAIEVAREIARGLAAAHEGGIVHRDLKPENIFLTSDGRVKLLDFGLAKAAPLRVGDTSGIPTMALDTEPGTVLGTVGYMAPEQARGQSADHRADIFAFGAVFYEMLTGQRAFRRDSAVETMHAILKEDPPPIETAGGVLPPGTEQIVAHCLEKNPAERFQSARDLAFGLDTLSGTSRSGRGTMAPVVVARRQVPSWALLAAGLVAGAAAGFLAARRRPAAEPPALRYLTYTGHDRSPAVSPDGRTLAFVSERDGRPRIWLKQIAGSAELALTPGNDDAPRFSPDGTSVLYAHTDGPRSDLYRTAILGGEPRKLVENATEGDWSPDGNRLAFLRVWNEAGHTRTSLHVSSSDGGSEREIYRADNLVLLAPRWSPDGRRIAISLIGQGNLPGRIVIIPAAGGKAQPLAPPESRGTMSSCAFNGDGKILYAQAENVAGPVSGSSSRILLQDPGSGRVRTLFWSTDYVQTLDILAPGRIVFDAVAASQNMKEITLPAGAERWLTRGQSNDRQPAFSRDGEWVAFSSNRNGNLDLWTVSTRTGAVRRVTDDAAEDWDPAFAPDGRILWSSKRGGHFEIWSSNADGSAARQVTRDGVDAENPTSTPDGRWIVYNSYSEKNPGVWKVHPDGTGAERLVAGATQWPEVSPDGRYVVYEAGILAATVVDRVMMLADGSPAPFEIRVPNRFGTSGRPRWMPDGRAIAFVGPDETGAVGVFVQDFVPGHDTTATRRKLAGFDRETPAETFGISPDGRRIAISGTAQLNSLVVADGVAGIAPIRNTR
jgi:Tol biopolymer transport system component